MSKPSNYNPRTLCLIQGDMVGLYQNRKQKAVYQVDWKSPEVQSNLVKYVEFIRNTKV